MAETNLTAHRTREGHGLRRKPSDIFSESIAVKQAFIDRHGGLLEEVARELTDLLRRGNKVLLFGNGGSAAEAQHIAAEFVNRFMIDRPPLAAVALTTDTSVITSISNDFDYSEIFDKQVRAIGKPGDAAVGLSTSGTSRNVLKALAAARELDLLTVGLGGRAEGPMREHCDYYLPVEGASTARTQEVHQLIGHTLVEIVEGDLFESREQG